MITRVSSLAMQKSMLAQLNANQNSYYEAQQQALTGKRINTLSDDPIGSTKILSLNSDLGKIGNYQKNVAIAQNEYEVLDSTMAEIVKKLQRVNELSVEAANEMNTPETLSAIKSEIDQIKETLVGLSNTQYNGQYIFSGANTRTPTYSTAADGSITYDGTASGDDYKRQLEVSDGIYLTLNAPGESVFGNYDATTDTGSGIFKTLTDLSKALETSDFDAIRGAINSNSADLESVSGIRTQFGGYAERADMFASTLSNSTTTTKEQKMELENIDLAEAYSNLSYQQYALQASMQVMASSMRISLLDYM